MRLLVDEDFSVRVAAGLRLEGHDVVHVTDVGLGNTHDATSWSARPMTPG